MQIPPGLAIASSRAAILTPSPKMSWASTITSPILIPTRKRMRRSSASPSVRSKIRAWNCAPARTASTALENSANNPSPVVFTIRPPCSVIAGVTLSARRAVSLAWVASSSRFISLLYPATSAASMAANLRCTRSPANTPSIAQVRCHLIIPDRCSPGTLQQCVPPLSTGAGSEGNTRVRPLRKPELPTRRSGNGVSGSRKLRPRRWRPLPGFLREGSSFLKDLRNSPV